MEILALKIYRINMRLIVYEQQLQATILRSIKIYFHKKKFNIDSHMEE